MIEGERGGERVWDALHPNALQIEKSTAYRENSLEVRGTRGEMRGARGVGREARGESYVLCRVTGEVGARVEREVLFSINEIHRIHFSCSTCINPILMVWKFPNELVLNTEYSILITVP